MTNLLPACLGVFVRSACPHERLFRTEYKRSNRNRGTKILRCFPHCCPSHEDRSYCGSSLEVALRFVFESDVASFDVDNVLVFARFETVNQSDTTTTFSLRYLRSVSQSDVNPEASWVEGVRQTTSTGEQHSQSPSAETSESATFVLNGQAFAKWYYHWESGANKVHRSTKHELRAYVFYQEEEVQVSCTQRAGVLNCHDQETASAVQREISTARPLSLLCVVTSPSFTVVSYRRAPLSVSRPFVGVYGTTQAALSFTNQPVEARLQHLVQRQISRAFHDYNRYRQQREVSDSSDDLALQETSEDEKDDAVSSERELRDQFRRFQEPEGRRFPLVTPENASLKGQIHPHPHSSRIVFDRTRRRDEKQQRRDTGMADGGFLFDDDEVYDEAVPQPQTLRRRTEGWPYENKAAVPVGIPPTAIGPVRQVKKTANEVIEGLKFQQLQLQNHQCELEQLTDLVIIHFFASHITPSKVGRLASLETILTIAIGQHWRYSPRGGAIHLAQLLVMVATHDTLDGMASGDEDSPVVSTKLEELVLVLGEVCIWAFSPENFELMQSLLSSCYPLLLNGANSSRTFQRSGDGNQLSIAYLECVGRCWCALDAFLQSPRATHSGIRRVRGLSDAILGIVYSDPELQDQRSELKALIQRPAFEFGDSDDNEKMFWHCNLQGWRGFMAQVREGYLRGQNPGHSMPWSPVDGTNAQPSSWSADWLVQPHSLSLTTQAGSDNEGSGLRWPSLWTSCLALSQLLHLKLAVVGNPLHTLYVQAEPSVLSSENKWLSLVCDGRVHVASVAPNGLTSLTGGTSSGFGGDYVAHRLEQQNTVGVRSRVFRGPQTSPTTDNSQDGTPICIAVYWWPQNEEKVAFRSVVTLKIATSGTSMDVQMNLERGSVSREAIEAAQTPQLEFWSPTDRVQAVTNWQPWLTLVAVYSRKQPDRGDIQEDKNNWHRHMPLADQT